MAVFGDDPLLVALVARATADPETLGLALTGSRGAGMADAASDYDLCQVLTEAAFARRTAEDAAFPLVDGLETSAKIDLWYAAPSTLTVEKTVSWMLPAFADTELLFDRDGSVGALVAALARMPAEKATADAAGWYDAYLNALYRSLKAWRRDNVLGARLHAAESGLFLLRTLYPLEGLWTPYHDRLTPRRLGALATQGWEPGFLERALLTLVTTGDPSFQQSLARRVEDLLRARGHGGVFDAWDGEIDAALAWPFPAPPAME